MTLTAKQLDTLSDTQILELAGTLGPGILGQAHYDRAEAIRKLTNEGQYGPALTDPNYAAKQAAKRAAERAAAKAAAADALQQLEDLGPEDDAEAAAGSGEGALDAWDYVTLSGAKMLAQEHGVSYAPRVKRDALVEALQLAGVQAPPPPAHPATEDDFSDV